MIVSGCPKAFFGQNEDGRRSDRQVDCCFGLSSHDGIEDLLFGTKKRTRTRRESDGELGVFSFSGGDDGSTSSAGIKRCVCQVADPIESVQGGLVLPAVEV